MQCGFYNSIVESIAELFQLIKIPFIFNKILWDTLDNPEKVDEFISGIYNLSFSKIFDGFIIFLKKLYAKIQNVNFIDLIASVMPNVAQVGYFIGAVIEFIVEIIVGVLLTGGVLAVEAIVSKFFRSAGSLIKYINEILGKLFKKGNDLASSLITFFSSATDNFLKLIDDLWAAIEKWIDELAGSKRKQILDDFESGKTKAGEKGKGKTKSERKAGDYQRTENYSLLKVDNHLESKLWTIGKNEGKLKKVSLHTPANIDAPGRAGIDAIYEFSNPPPKFIVCEVKYNTAVLSKTVTKSGGAQMSKNWIRYNLRGSISKDQYKEILSKGYDKILARVSKSGEVIVKEIKNTTRSAKEGKVLK